MTPSSERSNYIERVRQALAQDPRVFAPSEAALEAHVDQAIAYVEADRRGVMPPIEGGWSVVARAVHTLHEAYCPEWPCS